MDSGYRSLYLVARQHGLDLSLDRLRDGAAADADEPPPGRLVRLAKDNGLSARSKTFGWSDLAKLGKAYPVVARLRSGAYAIVTGYRPATDDAPECVTVIDPTASDPRAEQVDRDTFLEHWDRTLILLRRDWRLTDVDRPFSMAWLVGRFLQYKYLLAGLVLVSFVIHLFAVLPAVFIMIVLDKVVNFHATSTLYVITAGVVIAYLFNGILSFLRQYIVLFLTAKIDVRLNADVFGKLMNLPLDYFHTHTLPNVAKTVQQTTTIRQVLTGKFFGAVLDATSLIVFVPILYFYSPLLCAVVIGFAIAISANVIISSQVQKTRLNKAAAADGEKQKILMQSVTGIETVKSLALEDVQKVQWQEALARHITAHFDLGKLNAATQTVSATLQQLMTVAVIFIGVQLVFAGSVSAGVLIAVNMLAGRVTGPLVQLVTLATDLQKMSVAVDMLASVMNSRGESARRGLTSDIIGGIEFRNVTFEYPDGSKGLDDVSFQIKPRQRVAIVGRAGSGKTSILRLIQRLLTVSSGTISIDGQDVRNTDMGHLRHNIAAVTQEPGFFAGTIRENLLKPMPNAPTARLVWATKLVGIHEEIESLPEGYETELEEDAANLSMARRQKLAIARALVRNPKILILDEAISGFDVDSELDLRGRLGEINDGRTLVISTHRLSQTVDSDLILVMDGGRLVQSGNHDQLAAQPGLYAELWKQEMLLATGGRQAPGQAAE